MKDRNGNILISGDFVLIVAEGGTGHVGEVISGTIGSFNESIIKLKMLTTTELKNPFEKYPRNILKITKEKAMIYILEQ